jgi:hypothetical protein
MQYNGDGTYKRQWNRIELFVTSPTPKKMVAAVHHIIHEKCWTASCGYCAPERPRRTCPNDIRLTRLSIGDSSNGSGKAFSNALSMSWPKTFISAAVLIFAKRLSMAPSCRQKKGSCCRQDQARQRHQDHGSCRRFWSSCRHSRGKCFSPRSKAG